jgi:hypothetical protein
MNIKNWLNATHIKMTISKNWIELIGWIGSAFMVTFAFTLVIPFALIGLTMLTYQAYKNGMTNLIVLNVISAVGFALQLI